MCEHCKEKVEKSLLAMENVSKVKVDLKSKTATIYSEKNIEDENINNAIIELGYKITSIKE